VPESLVAAWPVTRMIEKTLL